MRETGLLRPTRTRKPSLGSLYWNKIRAAGENREYKFPVNRYSVRDGAFFSLESLDHTGGSWDNYHYTFRCATAGNQSTGGLSTKVLDFLAYSGMACDSKTVRPAGQRRSRIRACKTPRAKKEITGRTNVVISGQAWQNPNQVQRLWNFDLVRLKLERNVVGE